MVDSEFWGQRCTVRKVSSRGTLASVDMEREGFVTALWKVKGRGLGLTDIRVICIYTE